MALLPNEVNYNIHINKDAPLPYGVFYIGNGHVFIQGDTTSLQGGDKIKLDITIINSHYKYNTNYIVSNSYQVIDTRYYDTLEDAVNIEEMIKLWIQNKDFKCNKKFIQSTTFKINNGNLLNKMQYRTMSLVDYIVYNKMIDKNNMEYVPFCPEIRMKINLVYDKNIFDMNIFNMDIFNIDFEC
jgi:hypothetical protein